MGRGLNLEKYKEKVKENIPLSKARINSYVEVLSKKMLKQDEVIRRRVHFQVNDSELICFKKKCLLAL